MGKAKILVIDDIEINLNLIVSILEFGDEDYQIFSAKSALEGLEIIQNESPDIILLDWEMPVMNGIELLQRLKKDTTTLEIPVIMVTAYTTPEHVQEAMDKGAFDYIKKPVNATELRARVKSAIRLYKSIRTIKDQQEQITSSSIELNKLSSFVNSTDSSLIIIDNNGLILWNNEAFNRFHGNGSVSSPGHISHSLFKTEIYAPNNELIAKCLMNKENVSFIGQLSRSDEKNKWFHVTLTPILNDVQEIDHLIAVESDITEIKNKEEELNRKNQELTELMENLEKLNKQLEFQKNEIEQKRKEIDEERQRSDDLLRNIFPFEIAKQLKTKGFARPRFYPKVSVMFADFKSFSRLTKDLEPTEVVDVLDFYFKKFDEIIYNNFMEKIKTIGDAYMCVGGLPLRNRSNPFNAVISGIQIQQFMNELNDNKSINLEPTWELRLGIHTGSVVAGVVGTKKFAYDIWGPTVNIASRMESAGHVGLVNISGTTYEEIKDYFICTYRGMIEARNIGEIDMYFVDRIKPGLCEDEKGMIPNAEFINIINRI